LLELKSLDRIQIERHGFYVVDADTKDGAYVLNKTLNLKESVWKKKQDGK
jgi:hypothetical protein